MTAYEESILKCKFHGTAWNGYKVTHLEVSELWASVKKAEMLRGKSFFATVKEDIRKNGLHFPLIIVDTPRHNLIEQKSRYGDKIEPLPFDPKRDDLNVRQYTVWGGSNRWWVAHELGFKYVDCIIVPKADFNKARSMQAMHRAPYRGQLY